MLDVLESVLPMEGNRVPIEVFPVRFDTPGHFGPGVRSHVPKHAPGHLRKQDFYDVQPRRMLRGENELEPPGMSGKPPAGLLGGVSRMVVAHDPDRPVRRIGPVKRFQKLDELPAPVTFPDDAMDLSGDQVQSYQKGQGPAKSDLLDFTYGFTNWAAISFTVCPWALRTRSQ